MKLFLSILLFEHTCNKERKEKKKNQTRGSIFTTHSKHTFQLNSMELEKENELYIFILVDTVVIQNVLEFFLDISSENSPYLKTPFSWHDLNRAHLAIGK